MPQEPSSRPSLSPASRLAETEVIQIHLTHEQMTALEKLARNQGLSLDQWLIARLATAAGESPGSGVADQP